MADPVPHPEHPNNDLVATQLDQAYKEYVRLEDVAHQQKSSARRLLALIELAYFFDWIIRGWHKWFEVQQEKYRAAGRRDEFKEMVAIKIDKTWYDHHRQHLGVLRDECAGRHIDTMAFTQFEHGYQDWQDGLLDMSEDEADGTRAQRHQRAAKSLNAMGYNMPGAAMGDALNHLRVACTKEVMETLASIGNIPGLVQEIGAFSSLIAEANCPAQFEYSTGDVVPQATSHFLTCYRRIFHQEVAARAAILQNLSCATIAATLLPSTPKEGLPGLLNRISFWVSAALILYPVRADLNGTEPPLTLMNVATLREWVNRGVSITKELQSLCPTTDAERIESGARAQAESYGRNLEETAQHMQSQANQIAAEILAAGKNVPKADNPPPERDAGSRVDTSVLPPASSTDKPVDPMMKAHAERFPNVWQLLGYFNATWSTLKILSKMPRITSADAAGDPTWAEKWNKFADESKWQILGGSMETRRIVHQAFNEMGLGGKDEAPPLCLEIIETLDKLGVHIEDTETQATMSQVVRKLWERVRAIWIYKTQGGEAIGAVVPAAASSAPVLVAGATQHATIPTGHESALALPIGDSSEISTQTTDGAKHNVASNAVKKTRTKPSEAKSILEKWVREHGRVFPGIVEATGIVCREGSANGPNLRTCSHTTIKKAIAISESLKSVYAEYLVNRGKDRRLVPAPDHKNIGPAELAEAGEILQKLLQCETLPAQLRNLLNTRGAEYIAQLSDADQQSLCAQYGAPLDPDNTQ